MLPSLKLANLWRVIRDVDLDQIRATARTPFELLIVADDPDAGARVRDALATLPTGGLHPFVTLLTPDELPGRQTVPLVTVLVSAAPTPSTRLIGAEHYGVHAGWPRHMVAGVPDDLRLLFPPIVALVDGDMRLALASALPAFRPAVAEAIVDETAKANASFAATTGLAEIIPVLNVPLNLGDMVILTKNQLAMGYRIALAAGRDGEPRAMVTEILGVLGGGLLFRQMARQLVGLIPVAGLLPKVVIAYAGTYAIGRALTAWAMGGVAVSPDSISRYTADGLGRGRLLAQELLASVRTRAPSRRWQRLRGWLPPRRRGTAGPPSSDT